MERESPFSVSLEVKMAAKLVNLGFGFGPPRNPRSGPPWVSRAERRERKREQGKGGEEKGEGRGSGYGVVGGSRATHIYPPLCD